MKALDFQRIPRNPGTMSGFDRVRRTHPLFRKISMKRITLLVLIAISFLFVSASANAAAASNPSGAPAASGDEVTPLKFDRLDPSIDKIIPAGSTMERIVTGFTWIEGPVWKDGRLFFAEIPSNSIRTWTPGKGVSIFLQPSGYKGSAPYGGPESGSNGMTLDLHGRLTVAGHAQRDVYRFETLDPNGPITILADTYNGKQLNSPNDLVYKSDGSLYFTDPPYGLPTQQDNDPLKQLDVNGVYRIPHALEQIPETAPAREKLQLLVSDLTRPNGIAFSPDEKYLYVNNSQPKKIWMRYTVKPDGTLTDAKLLYDDTADARPGAPDGMKVDVEGNIYSAGPGGVWIFSPEGKALGTILMPGRVANVTWAGADRKMLYITGSDGIFRVHLKIAGDPLTKRK
jgi:gluconolactonase